MVPAAKITERLGKREAPPADDWERDEGGVAVMFLGFMLLINSNNSDMAFCVV